MYANNENEIPVKFLSPQDLGFHISPDITIECIKPKTESLNPYKTDDIAEEVNDDEENDPYFNPLIYCSVSLEETDECSYQKEIVGQQNVAVEKIDSPIKSKKLVKNSQTNENSSSICNGADSSFNPPSKIKKRFTCHVCQKTFGWTTDLKRHLLIHTGERPFKCTMCFATFTRNFLLQKHKSKIHQCLTPSEVSQLNNNVAKNIMEIKLTMRELEKEKGRSE